MIRNILYTHITRLKTKILFYFHKFPIFQIIVVSLIPPTSFGITDFSQRSYRRHIDTPYPKTQANYWETGLRESVYRTFLRKGYVDPSLRDQILHAPLLVTQYKQQEATPFGDIAVLARGQLYFAAGGFQFVQDEHSYDCDECLPLLRFDQGQIVALWTVKRLRHRDQNGYYRYETEYLISLVGGNVFKHNGAFNYDIPGYIFILKDLQRQNDNLWNRGNPLWYKQDEIKQFGFETNRHYLPPVFSTAATPALYYYTTPKTHFNNDPDIIPAKNNVRKEIQLYNMLLQTLTQAQPSNGVRFSVTATAKPFKPSPTYIKYSEPDPLYTTIRTPLTTVRFDTATRKLQHKVQSIPFAVQTLKNTIPPTTTQRTLTIAPFLPTPTHTKYPAPNLFHTTTRVPPTMATRKVPSTTSKSIVASTTTQKPITTTAFKSIPVDYTKYSEPDPLYTTSKTSPTTVRIESTTTKIYPKVQDDQFSIQIPSTTTQRPLTTTTFDLFDVFSQPKQKERLPQDISQTIVRNQSTKPPQHSLAQTIPTGTTVNIQTTTPRTPASFDLQNNMAETTTMMSVPTRTTLRAPISTTTVRTTTTRIPTTFTLVQTQSHFTTTVKFSTKLPSSTTVTESPSLISTVVKSSTELPTSTAKPNVESNQHVFTKTTESPSYLSTISKSPTNLPKSIFEARVQPTQNVFATTTESPFYLSTISKSSTELPSTMKTLVESVKKTTQSDFAKTTPRSYPTTSLLTETTKYLTTAEDITEKLTTPALTSSENALDQQTSFTETKYVATSTMTPTTNHLFDETILDERISMKIVNTTPRPIRKYTKIPTRTQIKNRGNNKSSVTKTTERSQNFSMTTAKFSTTDNIIPTTVIHQTQTEISNEISITTSKTPTHSTMIPNVEIQTQNPLQTTTLSATTNHVSTQGSISATSVNSGEIFDEIFGKFSKETTHTTPSTTKKIVTLNPELAEEIFGISPRNYESENESAQIGQTVTTEAVHSPKIIFDNFFEASTVPTTDDSYNNIETTTPAVGMMEFKQKNNITTSTVDLATEQTTIFSEHTTADNVERPKNDMVRNEDDEDDDLEIMKIITIQVRNVTKSDKRDTYNISEDVLKANVSKINVGDDNFLIYKAIVDGKEMMKIFNSTHDETDLFDNLALSVVNHAKSINYLNRKKHRSHRKKVYKNKTRLKGKMQ